MAYRVFYTVEGQVQVVPPFDAPPATAVGVLALVEGLSGSDGLEFIEIRMDLTDE